MPFEIWYWSIIVYFGINVVCKNFNVFDTPMSMTLLHSIKDFDIQWKLKIHSFIIIGFAELREQKIHFDQRPSTRR